MTDREKLTHFIGIYCYTSPRVCVCVNDMKKAMRTLLPLLRALLDNKMHSGISSAKLIYAILRQAS